jgi:hypothetical protein
MVKGAVAAIAVALIGAAATSAAAGPAASSMTVQATDLPGAKQVSAGRTNESGYDAYQRSFSYSVPSGSSLVIYVRSEVLLGSTTAQAGSDFAGATVLLRTKASQKAIAASLADSLKVPAKAVKVGKPKSPKVGDRAFEMPMTVTTKNVRLYSTLLYVLLDRAIVIEVVDGLRPESATSERLARRSVSYIGAGLAPVSVTPPSITGTAVQGQTLGAVSGAFMGSDTYAYQWQRCDATGANCAAVPGATAITYAVSAADAGSTLRVVVTATSRFGTVQATSAATAVVT